MTKNHQAWSSQDLSLRTLCRRAWSGLPELENSMSYRYFSKLAPEKTRFLKIAKTWTRKNPKIETRSNPFLSNENFVKKRWILAKFWSKFSLKPANSKTRWVLSQFSYTRKTRTRKILEFWNPKNSNPNLKEATKLEPEEI